MNKHHTSCSSSFWFFNDNFPEQQNNIINNPSPSGIAFSGGGSRSMVATMGQLRAFVEEDILSSIDYCVSVSGATWTYLPFCFYTKGAENDKEFLGCNSLTVNELTLDILKKGVPSSCIGYHMSHSFKNLLEKAVFKDVIGHSKDFLEKAWITAVGETFLKPYGLYYHENDPHIISLNEETLNDILSRNPELSKLPSFTVHKEKPFPIFSTMLVHPTGIFLEDILSHHPKISYMGYEFTPLYCGSSSLLQVHHSLSHHHSNDKSPYSIGGGFIESFAFNQHPNFTKHDGLSLNDNNKSQGIIDIKFKSHHMVRLCDYTGTSSSIGALYSDYFKGFAPSFIQIPFYDIKSMLKQNYPLNETQKRTISSNCKHQTLGDGGIFENTGAISLVKRKCGKIVLFINSMQPISLDYNPQPSVPVPDDKFANFLSGLFGYAEKKSRYSSNHVFDSTYFIDIMKEFQELKRNGDILYIKRNIPVVSNELWNVTGGWETELHIFYLETVGKWNDLLPLETKQEIEKKDKGMFPDFPNFKTVGENPNDIVLLTPSQVSLLAHQTHWCVKQKIKQIFT